MNSVSSIKKNALYNAVLKVLNVLFPLITFPYVARILSPSGIGRVDFVLSFVQYFIILAQFGIPLYALRECAKVRDNKQKLRKTIQEILFLNIVIFIIVFVFYTIIILSFNSLFNYRLLLIIAGANIFLTTIGVEWFFQAVEDYKFITIRSVIVKIIAVILIFTLVNDATDTNIYGYITVFAISANYILNFIELNRRVKVFHIKHDYDFKKHIKPIMIMFFMSLSISLYVNLDKVMLGFISGDIAVGIYSAANRMIKVILTLVTTLGAVLLPRMTYYNENRMTNEISRLIAKTIDFTLFISIPAAVGMFVMSENIIVIFAGQDFYESIIVSKILAPIIVAIALSNLIGIQILISHGKELLTIISTLAGAIVNISMNAFLIPSFAQVGASISTLFAEYVVLILQIIFAYSLLKGNFSIKSIVNYFIGSIFIFIYAYIINMCGLNMIVSSLVIVTGSVLIYYMYLLAVKNNIAIEVKNFVLLKVQKIRK